MATLLPPDHRRFRHVTQVCCRFVPLPHNTSSSGHQQQLHKHSAASVVTQFTLRDVAPEGGPGDLIYESEAVEGTIHPTWDTLPSALTEALPNLRRMVFSLYKINHVAVGHGGLQSSSTVEVPPVAAAAVLPSSSTTPTRGGEPLLLHKESGTPLEQEPEQEVLVGRGAGDEELMLVDASRSHLAEDFETSDVDGERDGVDTNANTRLRTKSTDSSSSEMVKGASLKQQGQATETGKKQAAAAVAAETSLIRVQQASSTITVPVPNNSCASLSKQLLFEFLIDLTKSEYVCKNFSALHDVPHIPAHIEDGSKPFSVLIKCSDGVFFPVMDGAAEDFNDRLPPSSATMMLFSNVAGGRLGRAFQNNATFLAQAGGNDDGWDLVDGDAARDAEARQQRTDNMTFGDVKALAVSSITLRRLQKTLDVYVRDRKLAIDEAMATDEESARLCAQESATTATVATCARLIEAKRKDIENLKKQIAIRHKIMDERLAVVREKQNALRSSPTLAALECGEEAQQRRLGLSNELLCARRALASDIALLFPLSSSSSSSSSSVSQPTICGAALPPETQGGLPETLEHAIAISHVCHAVVVFARTFRVALPHPIHLCPGRCRIFERPGVLSEDKAYPLYPGKNAERQLLRRGIDLLRLNIVSAAYHIHHQKQADGLPLIVAVEKLLQGR